LTLCRGFIEIDSSTAGELTILLQNKKRRGQCQSGAKLSRPVYEA